MALLDTCALLWWTLAPDRLSPRALAACERAERKGGVISSISIWEIGIKEKRGHLELGLPLRAYVERVRSLAWLTITPVDDRIWLANLELPWAHRDPADRTIVATAKLAGLPIVTKDRRIADFYEATIW